jgi:hypothetical protein
VNRIKLWKTALESGAREFEVVRDAVPLKREIRMNGLWLSK